MISTRVVALSRFVRPTVLLSTRRSSTASATMVTDGVPHVATPPIAAVALAQPLPLLEALFNANVHLGHKRGLWNPAMKEYILAEHCDQHIINLTETTRCMQQALRVVRGVAAQNGVILFVNTRPQFERLVRRSAIAAGEYFVTRKWVGGSLTNCHQTLGGNRFPDLVILTSLPVSQVALKEATLCNIPTIAIVDTDGDPASVTYPIPGNDDSMAALQLYMHLFASTILDAKSQRGKRTYPASP